MAKPNSALHQQLLTTAADLDAQYSELIELRQRVNKALLARHPDRKTPRSLDAGKDHHANNAPSRKCKKRRPTARVRRAVGLTRRLTFGPNAQGPRPRQVSYTSPCF